MELGGLSLSTFGVFLVVVAAPDAPDPTGLRYHAKGFLSLGICMLFMAGGERVLLLSPAVGPLVAMVSPMVVDTLKWCVRAIPTLHTAHAPHRRNGFATTPIHHLSLTTQSPSAWLIRHRFMLLSVPILGMAIAFTFSFNQPAAVKQVGLEQFQQNFLTKEQLATLSSGNTTFCAVTYDGSPAANSLTEDCEATLAQCSLLGIKLRSFWYTVLLLFEIVFGAADLGDVATCGNINLEINKEAALLLLIIAFGILVVVLLLNMLIAMMAKTFDGFWENADVT